MQKILKFSLKNAEICSFSSNFPAFSLIYPFLDNKMHGKWGDVAPEIAEVLRAMKGDAQTQLAADKNLEFSEFLQLQRQVEEIATTLGILEMIPPLSNFEVEIL